MGSRKRKNRNAANLKWGKSGKRNLSSVRIGHCKSQKTRSPDALRCEGSSPRLKASQPIKKKSQLIEPDRKRPKGDTEGSSSQTPDHIEIREPESTGASVGNADFFETIEPESLSLGYLESLAFKDYGSEISEETRQLLIKNGCLPFGKFLLIKYRTGHVLDMANESQWDEYLLLHDKVVACARWVGNLFDIDRFIDRFLSKCPTVSLFYDGRIIKPIKTKGVYPHSKGEFFCSGIDLALDDFDSVIMSFVRGVLRNPREAMVVEARLGLTDGKIATLDDIGKEINVTRERVRQILRKSMEKIEQSIDVLTPFLIVARNLIGEGGGILSLEELVVGLSKRFSWIQPPRLLALGQILKLDKSILIDEAGQLVRLKNCPCPKCKGPSHALKSLIQVNGLDEIGILDTGCRIASACQPDCRQTQKLQTFSRGFIIALAIRNRFRVYDDKIMTNKRWQVRYGTSIWEVIRATLEEIGQPTYYSTLAERIRQSNLQYPNITDHQVHACLTNYQRVFTVVGRGTYGLCSWKLDPHTTHAEAIVQLLKGSSGPMQDSTIVDRLTRDGEYKKQNLLAALSQHPKITKVAPGFYDLRERVKAQNLENDKLEVTSGDDLVLNIDDSFTGLTFSTDDASSSEIKPIQTESPTNSFPIDNDNREEELFNAIISVINRHLNTSYKPVLLLAILDSLDGKSDCSLNEVVTKFRDFYVKRREQGLRIERSSADIIEALGSSSLRTLKHILLSRPLPILARTGALIYDDTRLSASAGFRGITGNLELVHSLRSSANTAIIRYYGTIGEEKQ